MEGDEEGGEDGQNDGIAEEESAVEAREKKDRCRFNTNEVIPNTIETSTRTQTIMPITFHPL